MFITEKVETLRAKIADFGHCTVGFVPTMGALHEGHISLVRRARSECDVVVVSLFVNPTQFNDKEDLKRYPRTPKRDSKMLSEAGADILFMPSVDEIYPEEDTRVFDFGVADKVMEGATRKGHFNGVAQVVSRLFDIVEPERAYFGQKDFQQVAIVRAMVEQLGYTVEIVECATVRAEDGLALSSRNELLSEEHRAVAPIIYRALSGIAQLTNSLSPEEVELRVIEQIEACGLLKVIYYNSVDAITLQKVENWSDSEHIQGCVAVEAGKIRLIDNIGIK